MALGVIVKSNRNGQNVRSAVWQLPTVWPIVMIRTVPPKRD